MWIDDPLRIHRRIMKLFDIMLRDIPSIKRTKEGYIYEVEVPGVDKKDIKITHSNNYLIIEGERKKVVKKKNKKQEESVYFKKYLPAYPDGDYESAKAELKNGLLIIKVPYIKEGKPIPIE